MKPHPNKIFQPPALGQLPRLKLNHTGNVLLYVVVLMLIFGVLGVIMVSLFTTSTASTVTRNDTRRARYMSESGVRYAISEMRREDFEEDIIIDPLNTLIYTVSGAGTFDINIFSPWFDSNASVDSPPDISLSVPLGELPDDFTIPAGTDVWVVNYDYITGTGPDITTMRDDIDGYTKDDATNLTIDITSDFVVNQGERVCLAAEPIQSPQSLNEGEDLYVVRGARLFFPPMNGAVNINRVDYAYERLVDDPDNNRVILKNLTASQFPNTLPAFPLNVIGDTGGTYSGDFVVLSPRNHMVMAEGTSGSVTWGDAYALGANVYDDSLIRPDSRKPDITADDLTSNLRQQETDSRFFEVDVDADTLTIGGGGASQFGSAFFDATMNIGGERDYCQQGACLFALGVRVFFLLDFSSQGEGIAFTLLSGPPNNTASSAGGDFELSELIGYAGDSRTSSGFLATAPEDRGLDPPKIAVEFDTRTNNSAGDPPPDYCADASTVNTDTRNDPLTGNKDAVQYVFWGRTNFLNINCRGNNPLYDDNRHNADSDIPTEEWRFENPGNVMSVWRPAIGTDGTIYMSAKDATLYALNEDGTEKWTFNLGDNNDYMPGVDPATGTIYSDIFGNSLIAINPDGTEKWRLFVGSDIDSTPVVDSDGTIYVGTDAPRNSVFAVNPDGTVKWQFATSDEVDNVVALSPDETAVYFVSNDDNLYALNTAARIAGLPFPQPGEWTFPILAESGEVNSSPTVNPNDGTIYVGSDDHIVYAINPDGTEKWQFDPGTASDIESSPTFAIDPLDSKPTVYIGSDDDNVYAIDAGTGAEKWRFNTGANVISSPAVDVDGTIYIGSNDGNLYAINPDGTQKWFFATGAAVPSSPAIGQASFIHIGSNDTNFYTISQFADPRNFKDENKTEGKLLTSEDLDSSVTVDDINNWLNGEPGVKGPWAVRLEADRSLLPNPDGEFDYQLSLWIRQCQQLDCSDITGTFFQDTRIDYEYSAVPATLPMIQRFDLSAGEQAAFERFFFGFTGSTGVGQTQNATISLFQLSFIRPGDPVVIDDSLEWPP